MDPDRAIVLSPTVDAALALVNTIVMVVLIAAAVDRFLARPAQQVEAERA